MTLAEIDNLRHQVSQEAGQGGANIPLNATLKAKTRSLMCLLGSERQEKFKQMMVDRRATAIAAFSGVSWEKPLVALENTVSLRPIVTRGEPGGSH